MANRKLSSSKLSKHSILDLAAELNSRRGEVNELHARRDEIVAELEQLDSVLAALGGGAGSGGRGPSGKAGRPAKAAGKAGRRTSGRRIARGQGCAAIEAALRASKGSGTSGEPGRRHGPSWAA